MKRKIKQKKKRKKKKTGEGDIRGQGNVIMAQWGYDRGEN